MKDFDQLGLKKEIVELLERFDKPTKVQEKIIPLSRSKKNIVFTAKTGSGKTIAYTVGFLDRIHQKLGVQMLVVVPTRELCRQVAKEIRSLVKPLGLRVAHFYGGKDMDLDRHILRLRNHIVVATPGRFIVYVNEKQIKIGDVKLLVFDEGDEMFDKGFYDDCVYIKSRASADAQVILASATMTQRVKDFIDFIIGDYTYVQVGEVIPLTITQEKAYVEIPQKNDYVLNYLKQNDHERVLMFCNRKTRTDSISKFLGNNGYNASGIHSDLDQKQRESHLQAFKAKQIRILVATDVASRGLHIPDVDCVINYDIPDRPQIYVHRIGRTGRREKQGYALSLVCKEDKDRMESIEKEFELDIPVRD